mmetsp:Transcript_19468/g.29612  ORF Transcript_19468/g.29612 Transcript_19468/m.29612 type:complete len:1139 (+) Transcript_19468:99-3515(+)
MSSSHSHGQQALHPGILYFYSESFGLAANGICTLYSAIFNFGVFIDRVSLDIDDNSDHYVEDAPVSIAVEESPDSRSFGNTNGTTMGMAFIVIGGIVQFLCSLRAYRAHEQYASTAFGFFSAFWFLLGTEILGNYTEMQNEDRGVDFWNIPAFLFLGLGFVNILLLAVAFFVNAYYVAIMGSIAVAIGFETAIRFIGDEMNVQELKIAQGVSQLVITLIAGYGCSASILHGVYERHVLPGFQDAVIESSLWMRRSNIQTYIAGKWANPRPLSGLSSALGLIGISSVISVLNDDGSLAAFFYWFFAFSFLLWIMVFIFALRGEITQMINALADATLFAIFAYFSRFSNSPHQSWSKHTLGVILVCISLLRLFIFFFVAIVARMGTDRYLSSVETISYGCLVPSLLVTSLTIGFGLDDAVAITCSKVCILITACCRAYDALAELINSVAQKQILPVVFDWFSDLRKKKIEVLKTKLACPPTLRESVQIITDSVEIPSYVPPGDENLLGASDFTSPVSALFAGLSLYAIVSTGFLLQKLVFGYDTSDAWPLLLCLLSKVIVLTPITIMFGIRGQTSLAICSFSFCLDGILLLSYNPVSAMTEVIRSGFPLILAIVVLQCAWLATNLRLFTPLSFCVHLNVIGVSASLINAFPVVSNAWITRCTILGATSFAMMSVASLFTLGILLGCHGQLKICIDFYNNKLRPYNQVTRPSSGEEGANIVCPVGGSQHISQFDECVKILKEGGVCCIPTDTVYCLAATANNPEGIKRIYDIKSRPSEKPLSLWLSSIDDIKNVGPEGKGWGKKLFAFMQNIWPGSVSLVVSRGEWLNRLGVGSSADLIGTSDSIALRVPNSTLTVSLLRETGPLAITSANPSGACDCTHHNKVDNEIAKKIDYILADGPSPMTIASSVIDVRDIEKDEIFFYRVGCVPEAEIRERLRSIKDIHMNEIPLCSTISASNLTPVKSLMNLILQVTKCDKWHIYCLSSRGQLNQNESRTTMQFDDSISYKAARKRKSLVVETFDNGVSYYNDNKQANHHQGNCDYNGNASPCELFVPIRHKWGVCAVLHLANKRSHSGAIQPFIKADLNIAKLACTSLEDYIETIDITGNSDFDSITCRDEMEIVKFGKDCGNDDGREEEFYEV